MPYAAAAAVTTSAPHPQRRIWDAMAGLKITPDHGLVILSTASMCFYSILNGAVRYLPLHI